MVNNADNETIRLLFAILQQKNPKEIDWNLVAESEFLTEPIKNGHAARMRYCRLRDSICKAAGIDDRPKGRRTSDKGAITKPKRESHHDRKSSVRSDYTANMASLAQFSPASMVSSTFGNDSPREMPGARFLTPCSDDMTAASSTNSEAHTVCAESGEGFPPPGSQFLDANTHDPTSPYYSAFNNALDPGFELNDDPLIDINYPGAYNNASLF